MSKPLKNMRHEAFARAYVALDGNARRAYVAAGYNAYLGDDLQGAYPVDANASRLLRHAKVHQRIEGLRRAMAKRADITEDSIATELEEARKLAIQVEAPAAAVSATVAKAKLAGLMIDRKEIGDAGDFAKMSEDQLREYIGGVAIKANASNGNGVAGEVDGTSKALPAPTHSAPKARN